MCGLYSFFERLVKWTILVLKDTIAIFVFVQRPKDNSKVLFKLEFFDYDLYCCVEYSNVEYQVEIFKLIMKIDAQNHMIEYDFEHKFHDLNCYEVGILFSYSLNSLYA
jgi:hypothetical protein